MIYTHIDRRRDANMNSILFIVPSIQRKNQEYVPVCSIAVSVGAFELSERFG